MMSSQALTRPRAYPVKGLQAPAVSSVDDVDNVILPATALRAARCARAGGQMKIPSALDVLRARAREDSDLAAKALGQVRHACQQAAAKLEQLLAYELEYRQKLQSGLTAGIVSGDYENFQHFILTLETAIAQHRHALNQWKEKLHQAMALWQSKQQRLNALSTLHSRL